MFHNVQKAKENELQSLLSFMYFKKIELYAANTLNYICNFVRKFLSE